MLRLQNIATTDTMVNVMKEMTKILKINEGALDMKTIQKTMGEFMMQMEKQEIMNGKKVCGDLYLIFLIEQMEDIMNEDGEEVESDEATDKIINELEAQQKGGGNGGQKEVKKDDVILIFVHSNNF